MAIVNFGREKGYPKSSERLEGKRTVRTHRDRLKIITDDEAQFGDALLDQLPFLIGDYFATGTGRLQARDLDRDKSNRLLWYLDLVYDTKFDDEKDEDKNKPPDERKPEWWWDFEGFTTVFRKDAVTGKPIVNSVGEPIEDTYELALPVLNIERYEQEFDDDTIVDYVNTRNDANFWGHAQGSAWMRGIRDRKDSEEVYAGKAYRKVSFVIAFAVPFIADVLEGWKAIYLDHGTYYIDENTGNPTHFKDDQGHLTTGNLTAFGTKAAANEFNYLKFNKLPLADFGALNINQADVKG